MTDFYTNLFRNASEGDSSAKIAGHLPDWFNVDQVSPIKLTRFVNKFFNTKVALFIGPSGSKFLGEVICYEVALVVIQE
jgi:hypothetical protein